MSLTHAANRYDFYFSGRDENTHLSLEADPAGLCGHTARVRHSAAH
jgi:hypothetical protein